MSRLPPALSPRRSSRCGGLWRQILTWAAGVQRLGTLVAILALVGGAAACGPGGGGPIDLPIDNCEQTASVVHLFIAGSGDMDTVKWQRAMQAIGAQIRALITSNGGSPTVLISIYPLSGSSNDQEPLRAHVPCVSQRPVKPDWTQSVGMFGKRALAAAYQSQLRQFDQQLKSARTAAASVDQQLRGFRPSSGPVDIWKNGIAMATREFAAVESSERYVILVARDESVEDGFCTHMAECYALADAHVIWLGFDQDTDRLHTRAAEWAAWLKLAGASGEDLRFVRSSDPVPTFLRPQRSLAQ